MLANSIVPSTIQIRLLPKAQQSAVAQTGYSISVIAFRQKGPIISKGNRL
jgi:hypothetical protein